MKGGRWGAPAGSGWWRAWHGLALAAMLATAPGPAAADEWTARTGVHVDWWDGAGQNGHEVLGPFSLAFDTPRWGVSVRGAYGTSERDPGVVPSGSITGFTDTTLSGYYRLVLGDTEIRAGLNLDLPTGKSRLSSRDVAAIQDEDLVALDRFGEGLDVNPTLTVYHNFGAFGLGLAAGFLWTGEYDPTTEPADDIDPGDEVTVAGLGDVYLADAVRLIGRVAYTYYTVDQRRGRDSFREGDEIDLLVTVEWRPEPWWLVLTLRDIIRDKAERIGAGGLLVTEAQNSKGNEFRAGLTAGYILSDAWSVQGSVDVRRIEANDYAKGDPLHDGGRTKVAFGPGIRWTPHRRLAVEAGFRYFVMDVEEGPLFPRAGTINGVHADVLVTYRF